LYEGYSGPAPVPDVPWHARSDFAVRHGTPRRRLSARSGHRLQPGSGPRRRHREETVVKVEAVVFDAYGTLFDVHSVIARCEELCPGRGKELSHIWRAKQLEYTWLRSLMGRYEPF